MGAVREEAKKILDQLPEEVTWDDVIYEMYVRKKIGEGIKAADKGKMLEHEKAKKRLLRK